MDTCSTVFLCTEQLFNQLDAQHKLNSKVEIFQCYVIGDESVTVNCSVDLSLTFNNTKLKGKFFVVTRSVALIVLG